MNELLPRNLQRIDPRIDGCRLIVPFAKRLRGFRAETLLPALEEKLRMRAARGEGRGLSCGFQFCDSALGGTEDAIDKRTAARGSERDSFENG